MENPKFQIFTGKDDQYYFRLYAANGEIILASEAYVSKQGCRNGIYSVKDNAPSDERYRRERAADGQFYFVLTAQNGETIGVSETYTTAQSRDGGIEAVKDAVRTIYEIAHDAQIEDISA